jgi:hypothetical protein
MYDPATGRTYDGISGDGVINRNSGAESTIHGLLSMLALDANPGLVRLGAGPLTHSGLQVVEGESASGGQVVTPPSAWTGESQWSNGSYVSLAAGDAAEWTLPASTQPRLVLPVVNLLDPGRTTWTTGSRTLGAINHAAPGPQGISAAPGVLQPITLSTPLPPYATGLKATAVSGTAQIDALLLIPTISTLRVGSAVLLSSVDPHPRTLKISTTPGATAYTYTTSGVLHSRRRLTGSTAQILIQPGGFTVVL